MAEDKYTDSGVNIETVENSADYSMSCAHKNEKDFDLLADKYGAAAAERLYGYMDGVLEWNEHINLTAITDRDEFFNKHILDSLSAFDSEEFQNASRVIDIGTGGGFPGVPLAIVAPDKEFVLLDSTKKKLRVINELTSTLRISNVSTVHARAEEIGKKPEYAGQFDVCVTRAVADLKILVKWCIPFIKRGGFLIAYKGPKAKREVASAEKELFNNKAYVDRIEQVGISETGINEHNLVFIKKR